MFFFFLRVDFFEDMDEIERLLEQALQIVKNKETSLSLSHERPTASEDSFSYKKERIWLSRKKTLQRLSILLDEKNEELRELSFFWRPCMIHIEESQHFQGEYLKVGQKTALITLITFFYL